MTSFKGQVSVITGAGSGIGRAIALGLSARGASVCLAGRNLRSLEQVASEARATGSPVWCYQVDLNRDDEIQDLASALDREHHELDILIHSAGVFSFGSIRHTPVEELDLQYRTNVRAPYVLTRALLPMLGPRKGQIVFLNSSAGLRARGRVGPYAASKHALKALADSIREELNPEGMRVLSVFPGRTATPMQARVHELEGKDYHPHRLMQPQEVAEVIIHSLGIPRGAEVTDIQIRPIWNP